jgi:type IV pilus assembly protein PilQ
MSKKRKITFFISSVVFLVLGLFLSLSQAQSLSPVISMDFQDADLKDVLKVFSQQADLNFIASENVKDRKVTLYLDKVSVEDALNTIMSANNLTYEQKRNSKIFVVKEWGRPEVETITKIFPLQHARVKGCELTAEGEKRKAPKRVRIKEAIAKLLTKHGQVIENSRTNSLIVTDIPTQFPRIEETIEELDKRVLQVMIEVEIIEASVEAVDKLGIEWGMADAEGELFKGAGSARSTKWPFMDKGEGVGIGGDVEDLNLNVGYLSAMSLGGILTMLAKDTDTKTLARPKILTLNGEEARIIIGERYPYRVKTVTETSTTEETKFEAIGTVLRVTPWVTPEGWITMYVHPEVSSLYASLAAGPHVYTSEAEVTVRVRNGETVVIGGLIKTKDTKSLKKVPFLGDIPLLGNLFRYKDDKTEDKELIIFLTPHSVKEGAATLGLALERQAPWEYENLGLKEEAMEMFLDRFEE